MIGTSEKENTKIHELSNNDFDLGIVGFKYSDLYDAEKLREIAEKFYAEVEEQEPILGDALKKYIASHGVGYEKKVESKILTDAAPFLSDFIARMFGINRERAELHKEISNKTRFGNTNFLSNAAPSKNLRQKFWLILTKRN